MRVIALILAAAATASAWPSFAEWKTHHGKSYTIEESLMRQRVYESNVDMIDAHNADETQTWTMAMNKFGDLLPDEFASRYLGLNKADMPGQSGGLRGSKPSYWEPTAKQLANIPAEVKHCSSGDSKICTPIKNQEQCGSCWAFSTTESIESAVAIATGKLTSLSEQQLVDCSDAYNNEGCNGGNQNWAFRYAIKNGGLSTEKCYPYEGTNGNCRADKCTQVSPISNFEWVPPSNNTIMQAAITMQPQSIGVAAASWSFYSGGILGKSCTGGIDHAVIASGYYTDSQTGELVYIVRNSWGASWGLSGFIHLSGAPDTMPTGACCVVCQPLFPTVGGTPRSDDSPSQDYDDPDPCQGVPCSGSGGSGGGSGSSGGDDDYYAKKK